MNRSMVMGYHSSDKDSLKQNNFQDWISSFYLMTYKLCKVTFTIKTEVF